MMSRINRVPRRPVILIIMDGIGVNPGRLNNAVALASTPNLDRIYASHSTCLLEASGRAVGLPDGQMGNSEVGHMTIGAGTILKQDLVKISDAIADGSFTSNAAICSALQRAKNRNKPIHLLGLVSDGGVHSHIDHLIALINLCQQQSVTPMIHMITDGRDTAPSRAEEYLAQLQGPLKEAKGKIVTVMGRYYAMDRDQRWDRIESAWKAIVQSHGRRANSAEAALEVARKNGETDEFIVPTVVDTHQKLSDDDEFVFFNFRSDRPRELSEALAFSKFEHFERGGYSPVLLTTMTRYKSSFSFPYAFSKDKAGVTLGQIISDNGISQLRAAETEKYPHVTFFFNGGKDDPYEHEVRLLVDSPKVATYDLKPEMSAVEISHGVETALADQQYGFIVVNFANGDMVGHTGVREAVVSAVEVVDAQVGRLWDAAIENGYSIVLTADHGNADMLLDPVTGHAHTQHTTFPVACVVHDEREWRLKNGCGLTSVASTVLELMGLRKTEISYDASLLL